ncbi:hypothetical protein HFN88_20890 [Rhizobium laguerreae]|uniref:restriction endonuclease subunit S n=1 Tax=Rhizobium laguerreae TaxID=1076926 RepID=UPI001C911353|nr:restriction endonuclease subunit S [Rhizobium laguerreae]MBY3395122.1 hypothetical protein [Rhizobium laguerreae]
MGFNLQSDTVKDLQAAGVLLVEDGNHGENRPRPDEFAEQGVSFIRAADMDGGRILFGSASRINDRALRRIRKGIGQPGDIILSHKGTVGKLAAAPLDCEPFVCSPQTTFWRVLQEDQLDRRFLYFFMNSIEFKNQLSAVKGETDMADYVSLTAQRRLQIPRLPLAVQQEIGRVLGSLDDKIELNLRMNETLEAMAQAIFRDWFVDFGPSRRKLDGETDPVTIMGGLVQDVERAQAYANLFPATIADDGLPDGWEEKQVGDVVALIKRGLAPSYSEDGILVINQKCIRNKAVNLAAARRHDVVKRPPRDRLLEEYDVVVNSTGVGTLGRVATVRGLKEEATADSHVTICRADTSKVSKLILSLFMEGQEALIETMGHGSTGQTELSPASLSAMTLAVASKPVQLAFDNFVMPLRNLVISNSEQSLTLAETRDLLLPKLMSGEIRLGEAVEAAA